MLTLFKRKKKDPEHENRITMFLNAGIEYFKKKDYISSKKYFERVLEIEPANTEAENYMQVILNKISLEEKKRFNQQQIQDDNDKTAFHGLPPMEQRQPPTDLGNQQINKQGISGIKDRHYYYKVLRLDLNAAPEDIRDSIALEFKKWRTRVNSPDINKRYEAEEMLNLISQAKRVLLPE